MKYVGMCYGMQLDPVEPRAPEESNGRDGLGVELNLDNEISSSEDEGVGGNDVDVEGRDNGGHTEEWFRGLSEHISENARDYLGDGLENDAWTALEKRWWETYDEMETFARIHLSIPVGRAVGGTREGIANLIAETYDYEG